MGEAVLRRDEVEALVQTGEGSLRSGGRHGNEENEAL
jgi:hypothetical protein